MDKALETLQHSLDKDTWDLQLKRNGIVDKAIEALFNQIKVLHDEISVLQERCKKLEGMVYPKHGDNKVEQSVQSLDDYMKKLHELGIPKKEAKLATERVPNAMEKI